MDILAFIGASWWAWLIAMVVAFIVAGGLMAMFKEDDTKFGCITAIVTWIIIFALVFGSLAAISSYTTIQRGTVGLVSRFGALTGVVFQPGLHWKTPFIESVEVFDTTQQSYEMSANPETTNAQWPDYQVGSQTSDGQSVKISATTIFRIPDGDSAVAIRQNIGPTSEVVENVVKANVRSVTRNLAKTFTAQQLYTGDILDFQEAVRAELERKFAEQGEGLVLADFLIRGIGFEEKYSDAVEAKQIAAENIITQENNARAAVYEAQRTAALAKGEADAAIERAIGAARAVELDADAQAYAIEEVGKSLTRYESVLQLRFIENLNDKTLFLPSDTIEYFLPLEAPEGGE